MQKAVLALLPDILAELKRRFDFLGIAYPAELSPERLKEYALWNVFLSHDGVVEVEFVHEYHCNTWERDAANRAVEQLKPVREPLPLDKIIVPQGVRFDGWQFATKKDIERQLKSNDAEKKRLQRLLEKFD